MALYSFQIEKHFLGGLIQNPEVFTEVEGFIEEKTFYSELHGTIYSCFRSAFLAQEKIDKVLLAQKIKNIGISVKGDIDIFSYIEAISFTQITAKATLDAAKELSKLMVLRKVELTCDKIKESIHKNVNEPLQSIITSADSLYSGTVSNFDFVKEPEELFFDIYEEIEKTGNNQIEETGLVWPYPEFNRLYGGARGGNVYAIAARPAQGKSTFLSYTAIEMGKLNGVPVLYLDTEMSTKEVKFRTAAAFSGVPLWYLETGKWRNSPEYVDKVRNQLKNLKNHGKFYHYHVGNRNVDEVCSIIRRWYLSVVGRGNKCIVVYDYLKLTGEKMSQNWAEHQVLGEKVDKFKRISEELDFPLITAIQLNRSGENTGRQSSDFSDDGSAIAQTDRLQWFATYLAIFRRRTEDEMILDTLESGTHKLIEIKGRFQGRDAAGHQNFIRRTMPDGKVKYVRNFLNFDVNNFAIIPRGSLIDSIARQNASFTLEDDRPVGLLEETL